MSAVPRLQKRGLQGGHDNQYGNKKARLNSDKNFDQNSTLLPFEEEKNERDKHNVSISTGGVEQSDCTAALEMLNNIDRTETAHAVSISSTSADHNAEWKASEHINEELLNKLTAHMQLHNMNANKIASSIGFPRSYLYGWLKRYSGSYGQAVRADSLKAREDAIELWLEKAAQQPNGLPLRSDLPTLRPRGNLKGPDAETRITTQQDRPRRIQRRIPSVQPVKEPKAMNYQPNKGHNDVVKIKKDDQDASTTQETSTSPRMRRFYHAHRDGRGPEPAALQQQSGMLNRPLPSSSEAKQGMAIPLDSPSYSNTTYYPNYMSYQNPQHLEQTGQTQQQMVMNPYQYAQLVASMVQSGYPTYMNHPLAIAIALQNNARNASPPPVASPDQHVSATRHKCPSSNRQPSSFIRS